MPPSFVKEDYLCETGHISQSRPYSCIGVLNCYLKELVLSPLTQLCLWHCIPRARSGLYCLKGQVSHFGGNFCHQLEVEGPQWGGTPQLEVEGQ
jgi:hypothetical protein